VSLSVREGESSRERKEKRRKEKVKKKRKEKKKKYGNFFKLESFRNIKDNL
jgi:hypothetical protein